MNDKMSPKAQSGHIQCCLIKFIQCFKQMHGIVSKRENCRKRIYQRWRVTMSKPFQMILTFDRILLHEGFDLIPPKNIQYFRLYNFSPLNHKKVFSSWERFQLVFCSRSKSPYGN